MDLSGHTTRLVAVFLTPLILIAIGTFLQSLCRRRRNSLEISQVQLKNMLIDQTLLLNKC